MRKVISYVVSALLLIALVGAFTLSCKPAEVETKVLKMAYIGPQSGFCAVWGIPAAQGFQVWADDINARGGIEVGGVRYMIEAKVYDDEGYIPAASLTSAKKAVLEDGVRYVMTTATDAVCETVHPFLKEHGVLQLTIGASEAMRPEWPNLIGACTQWPNNVTVAVQYLAEQYPEVKRAAIIMPDTTYGVIDKMWWEIACEAQGFDVVFSELVDVGTVDWYPLTTRVLATKPDVIMPGITPAANASIVGAARSLGYKGRWVAWEWWIPTLLEKVPADYIEGFMCVTPPMNNPAIVGDDVYRLYQEYCRRWEWEANGCISWWAFSLVLEGIKAADSVDPTVVGKTLLAMDPIEHPLLGESRWGGMEMFGVNNLLMTPWYVGQIKGGELKVVARLPFTDWWDEHKDLVLTRMKP